MVAALRLEVPGHQPAGADRRQPKLLAQPRLEIRHVCPAEKNRHLLFARGHLFSEHLQGHLVAAADQRRAGGAFQGRQAPSLLANCSAKIRFKANVRFLSKRASSRFPSLVPGADSLCRVMA